MPHGDSNLLAIAEVAHWIGLAIMMTVYTIRLVWLFRFAAGRDRQMKGERAADNAAVRGGIYSLMNVAMPWEMESTRKGLGFYLSFVAFHLGVTFGILMAFTSAIPGLHSIPAVAYTFIGFVGLGFLVAVGRIVRRFSLPHLRLISTPDDYFSLFTLTAWFGFGVLAEASALGLLQGDVWLAMFLFATTFFLIYVPFSKISHYLYYPFTRWWLGKTLGHRGSIPFARAEN